MDCKETASRLEAKNSNYGVASFAVRLNQVIIHAPHKNREHWLPSLVWSVRVCISVDKTFRVGLSCCAVVGKYGCGIVYRIFLVFGENFGLFVVGFVFEVECTGG